MKNLFLFFILFLVSCEKYTTNVSDLTMSGEYKISKLRVIQTGLSPLIDTTYSGTQLFVDKDLPDPFDSIRLNKFCMHFDYSKVMIDTLGKKWKYVSIYHRVPWTYDAYRLGAIKFQYLPSNRTKYVTITLNVDNDGFEFLQLSGTLPNTKYRLVFTLTRVGP